MNPQNNSEKPKINKDAWLFLFIVFPVVCIVAFNRCSAADVATDNTNCYEQASQDIFSREGNKRLATDDIERYGSEMASQCR